MNTWTFSYEEEDPDGTWHLVHQAEVPVPDDAGLLEDAKWADWLTGVHEPEEWRCG